MIDIDKNDAWRKISIILAFDTELLSEFQKTFRYHL
jgi:hypothetical protein